LAQCLIVCLSCGLGKPVKQHGLTEFILDHSYNFYHVWICLVLHTISQLLLWNCTRHIPLGHWQTRQVYYKWLGSVWQKMRQEQMKYYCCAGVCVLEWERGREGGRLQWLSTERCPLGIMASSAFQETTYNSLNIQWMYIQCFSHINTSHNGLLFNILSSDIRVPWVESCYYRGKWGEHNNHSSKGLFPSFCLTDTRPSGICCRYSYAESREGNSRRRKREEDSLW
jgi:hypothetical protein